MKTLRLMFGLILALSTAIPTAAQDAASVWNVLNQPAADAAKSAAVEDLMLTRDRIRITLMDGTIQFMQPATGVVFGAAFEGHGRLQVSVPNTREEQQLRLFTKQDGLSVEFTQATFSFTDKTFEEVARKVKWVPASSGHLGDVYAGRQHEREDLGAEIVPRLFQGVLSADHARTAEFLAEVKTEEGGWIEASDSALRPEEIRVGRWTDWIGAGFKRFDTWLSFPAGNRSSSDAYKDPLAKETFIIHGYQIDARATSGAELSATTKVNLEQRIPGERVLRFLLDSNLRVDSVKDEKGAPLTFFQARERKLRGRSYGDYVAVFLLGPTQAGQMQTLEFHYAGKQVVLQKGNGNYFCESFGWYPTIRDAFASRADFQMTFRIPKKFTLVATGDKLSQTTDGNESVSTWKSNIPLAVAGFAFGDYKVVTEKVGDIEVEIFANYQGDDLMKTLQHQADNEIPRLTMGGQSQQQIKVGVGTLTPSAMAKTMSTEVANMLKVDQMFFGPYPYKRLAVTNIPLDFGYGQGWPMLLYLSAISFLDSTQRNELGVKDQVLLSDYFRAHETSHQWWGHKVSWKSYHDQWLSEGFAQFSGNLYVQFRQNMNEYLTRLRLDKKELIESNRYGHGYDSLGPIWMGARLSSSLAPAGYNVVVYNKGGYVLEMLRAMLFDTRSQDPEKDFKEMMQDFCKTYDNKAASTEDFKAIVEKHMTQLMDLDGNHKMDWFFNQYVYGTGIPQYSFTAGAQGIEGGKWKVSGTLTQSGVPDGWKDILPVYVHLPGRTVRLGWLEAKGKTTPFQIVLPTKPDKVTINDNEEILAEVK